MDYAKSSSLETTQSVEEDPLLDAPLVPSGALDSEIRPLAYSLPTACVAVLLAIIHIVYTALAFALGIVCSDLSEASQKPCESYISTYKSETVISSAKLALWLLYFLFERYIDHLHNKARNQGYFSIYNATKSLSLKPLLINSAGSAMMLLIISFELSVTHKVYMPLILAVLGLEMILSLLCLLIYTVRISRFNRSQLGPDINHEDRMQDGLRSRNIINLETGFREDNRLEEIVEKQADLIEYLKLHNTQLSKRLLTLTSQQIRD